MRPSRRQFLAALAPSPRPNILFIMADDLGYADLSCYGRRDYQTPHLDRLAAQGVRLTQAYANACVCSPTRTALLTGRYQYRLPVGLEEPISSRSPTVGIPPSHPTLASLFRAAGYHTSLVGKWHLGTLPGTGPLESGYHDFFGYRMGGVDYFTHKSGTAASAPLDLWEGNTPVDQPGYLTDLLADRAETILAARAKDRQPFLLSLHFSAPHWPWQAPGDEFTSSRLTNLSHWEGGTNATYARMVQIMDQRIGHLLKSLDDKNLAHNTLVVFTSDNGGERFSDNWPFSGRKAELLEGGIRVPAIIRWPGHIRPDSTTHQVAISMDWLPTLLAAAGLQPDPAYPSDGINLLPTLSGPLQARTLFWRHRADQQRALRQGDWKLLRLRSHSYLFHLTDDPLERANRKSAYPELFARLNSAYDSWSATMLPENPAAYSYAITGEQQAERYGHPPTIPAPPPPKKRSPKTMAGPLVGQLATPPALRAALHYPDPLFIQDYASQVFGDSRRAGTWLRSPNSALGNTSPQRCLASGDHESMRRVLRRLIQLDYGVQS